MMGQLTMDNKMIKGHVDDFVHVKQQNQLWQLQLQAELPTKWLSIDFTARKKAAGLLASSDCSQLQGGQQCGSETTCTAPAAAGRASAAHVETVDKLPIPPPITAVMAAVAGADMVQVARAARSAALTAQAPMLAANVPSGSHSRRLQP
jgi:hypothetical protein